jgi:hypothetical protein
MGNKKKSGNEEVPQGQVWFDKIFLWFILSLAITGVMYTVWGLIETLNVPVAPY